MSNFEHVKKYRKLHPWARPREYARRRCVDPRHKDFKYYGARGIRFFLTMDDCRDIYARDHAYKMTIPTIDRIDPDGDYVYSNCRFMERDENVDRRRKRGEASHPVQQGVTVINEAIQWEE